MARQSCGLSASPPVAMQRFGSEARTFQHAGGLEGRCRQRWPPGTLLGRCRPRWSGPRVVGQVAGEADGCLRHSVPVPVAWPGGLPCPWNRGTVDTVACQQASRGKQWSQRSRPCINSPTIGRLGCRVGWWGACGWGSGMPAPSGQIPPPWAWWENEAPATRAARRPVPGSSRTTVGGPAARCAARPCSSPRRRHLRFGGDRSCLACWRSRRCGCRRPWRSGCRRWSRR